jgi:hypothetical protein
MSRVKRSAIADALRRIEERIELLACGLATVDDRVGIIDLKLEGLDSIFDAVRAISHTAATHRQ